MTGWKNAELNSQLVLLRVFLSSFTQGGERKSSSLPTSSTRDTKDSHRTGKHSAFSYGRDNTLAASSRASAPSDVYARLQSLPEQLCQQSLALYGVEQRKWPWLLRGWPAALQPSTSTSCTYMAWPKNEITTVFSDGILGLLSSKD